MKNIKIYGDSVLKGVMYSETEGRYKLAQDNSYESLKNIVSTIQNNSRMGATIEKGINIMKKSLTENYNDDTLIIFEYGSNDCDYIWKEISNDPCKTFQPKTPVDTFIKMYHSAIQYAKELGAKIAISSLVPIDAEKYMQWITKGLNYTNILKWLGDIDHLARWQSYYNDIVLDIAKEENCPVIDFRNEFLNNDYKQLLCKDGIHPTQKGHDLITNTIRNFCIQQ